MFRRHPLTLSVLSVILTLTFTGCDTSSSDKSGTVTKRDAAPEAEPVARPARPDQGYVGTESCADCHADVAAAYQTHPMAHSLTEILEEPIEDYETAAEFRTSTGRVYRVEAAGTEVAHTERLLDRQDHTIYEQTVPVQFAVGSGQKGRSYLINHNGLLFMSPVTWYSEKQRFDLSPGYESQADARFGRRVSDGCLTCHAGVMNTIEETPNRYASSPFFEKSIGCERCHGPGREHIAFHNSSKSDSAKAGAKKDPIVNPAHLSPQLREDICSQCHLQGLERILRYGRTEFDFRPGDRLSDIWATFVLGDSENEPGRAAQLVSQVEQMHSSRCFQHSNGQMTCTSCHDPHRSPDVEQRDGFYRERCLTCHEQSVASCAATMDQRRSENDSCVNCHMPRLPTSNIPHTSQTDHRILRTASPAKEQINSSPPTSPPRLFQESELDLPPLVNQRVHGLMMASSAKYYHHVGLAEQALTMLKPLPAVFPEDEELLDALGMVNYLVGDDEAARKYWLQTLEVQPKRESAFVGLILVESEQQNLTQALQYLNELLELNPWKDHYHFQKAKTLVELGKHVEGIAAAQKGLEIDPGSVPMHRLLIEACESAGQSQQARDYRKKLERIQRALPPQLPQQR